MSLIHDALKKAQDKEKAPIGSGLTAFQDLPEGKKLALTKRTIVLIALVVVALGFLAYNRFSSPDAPAPTDIPTSKFGPTPGAVAPGQAAAPAPEVTPGGAGEAPDAVPGQAPGGAQAGAAQPAPGLGTGAEGAEQSSDVVLMNRRAIEAFKNDELDSALASIRSAAVLAPKSAQVWNNKGFIEKKFGELEEARRSYEKALELKPDYPETLNNLAMLEYAEGKPSTARELLQKTLTAVPAYPEANFNMGFIYDKGGDKTRAIDYYRRFLDVSGAFPSNVVEAVRDRVMELER